jgi:transcriptional regulator with XRE-family HTH domain
MGTAGNRFKRFRETLGLNREEMAELIGRTSQAIGDIERDGSFPRFPHLEKLSQEYGLNLNWMGGHGGSMFLPGWSQDGKGKDSTLNEPQTNYGSNYILGEQGLSKLIEKLSLCLPEKDQPLLDEAKQEIDRIVSEANETNRKYAKVMERLVDLERLVKKTL